MVGFDFLVWCGYLVDRLVGVIGAVTCVWAICDGLLGIYFWVLPCTLVLGCLAWCGVWCGIVGLGGLCSGGWRWVPLVLCVWRFGVVLRPSLECFSCCSSFGRCRGVVCFVCVG